MQAQAKQQSFNGKKDSSAMEEERRGSNFQYEIKASQEFDLATCFKELPGQDEGYQKDCDYYFDSYSHFNIHEEMLKDQIRTKCYQNAIMKNKHLFQDKIVLDVGSGTGILSIFAAKAGAKHVYGVDNANIVSFSRQIVEENGLTSKVTIIKGKIEEIELPVEKVDIIISEWMGYFLLYESMLDCVLFARDKYLADGGLMFPDRAVLFLATIEDGEYMQEKLSFWDNLYGVSMKCIKKWVMHEPLVENCPDRQINGDACAVLDVNLQKVKASELNFASEYTIRINRNDYVHGFVSWFEVYFSHCHIPIRLSTSPYYKETHWKQTIFYFNQSIAVCKGDKITGSIAVKKSQKNPRDLDIRLSVRIANRQQTLDFSQFYKMN